MLRNLKISIIKNLNKNISSPFHDTVVPEKNKRSTFIPILLIYSIKIEIMTILV